MTFGISTYRVKDLNANKSITEAWIHCGDLSTVVVVFLLPVPDIRSFRRSLLSTTLAIKTESPAYRKIHYPSIQLQAPIFGTTARTQTTKKWNFRFRDREFAANSAEIVKKCNL